VTANPTAPIRVARHHERMLPLPARLAATAATDSERRDWLAGLPETVRDLAARWSLTLGPPFQPGGEVSWVAPARDARGRDLVLKIGWRHLDAAQEAAGLRAWSGRGAVRVFAAHDEEASSAMLLERCRPGTSLATVRSEPEQDEVVAALLRRLWHEPAAGHPFRSLELMCDEWAAGFEIDHARQPDALDPGIARAGMALFRGLAREYGTDVGRPQLLLATDLHAGNVLAAHREPWLAIDPKPHVGDPAYDVLQHLLNCPARLTTDPGGLADRLSGLLDLDAHRVRLWLFARCVQECVQQPWLRPVASILAPS
jgi:streptomycin 6-kinase